MSEREWLEGLLPDAQERDREDGAARHRQQLAILTRFRDRLDDALVSTADVDLAIAYHRAAIRTYDGGDA